MDHTRNRSNSAGFAPIGLQTPHSSGLPSNQPSQTAGYNPKSNNGSFDFKPPQIRPQFTIKCCEEDGFRAKLPYIPPPVCVRENFIRTSAKQPLNSSTSNTRFNSSAILSQPSLAQFSQQTSTVALYPTNPTTAPQWIML